MSNFENEASFRDKLNVKKRKEKDNKNVSPEMFQKQVRRFETWTEMTHFFVAAVNWRRMFLKGRMNARPEICWKPAGVTVDVQTNETGAMSFFIFLAAQLVLLVEMDLLGDRGQRAARCRVLHRQPSSGIDDGIF